MSKKNPKLSDGQFSTLARPKSLPTEIAKQISEKINSGIFPSGSKLPTEAQISQEFGVSRTAVREAIASLRQEGMVETHQGVGAFVANDFAFRTFQIDSEKLQTVEDLRSVMELRIEMEVGGAAMAARRRSTSQLSKMNKILENIREAIRQKEDCSLFEQEFQLATAEASNNKHFSDFVQFLSSRLKASIVVERAMSPRNKEALAKVLREYEEIYAAILVGDPDKARRAAWYHVLRSAERLGLRGLQGWEESRMTLIGNSHIPVCAAADPVPKKPKFGPPAGACDCHAHILGPQSRYPYTPHRTYTPPDAPLASYQEMLNTLGLDRAVIVQPSVYGTDNRVTLNALRKGGPDFRGVVVVDEEIDNSEMERMHELGVRGVRINLLFKSGIEVSDVRKLAQKIAPFGWHLQMLVDVSEFSEIDTLADLPVDVVFDHMGHMPTSIGVNHPGFKKMLKMLERGQAWAKLSGPYRITCSKALPYADTTAYAKAIINANPEQVVWATDWPHPYINVSMPNDGDLLDLLSDWVPDTATKNRILVDNPAKLYEFDG